MNPHILLASDLDRTLLPNGTQEESPAARPLLRAMGRRAEIALAYVSGRHLALVDAAIAEFDVPVPTYVIGDVGSTIYYREGGRWVSWTQWGDAIAPCWNGYTGSQLMPLFEDLQDLRLQEPARQMNHKLSYYTATDIDRNALLAEMKRRLAGRGVRASLIWSMDETSDTGLLDVLPETATKLGALRFLMQTHGFALTDTVFAGDSGNDLPVLTSELQGILVANAQDQVREEAERLARAAGHEGQLYLAHGGFLGMNGNYCAGVLEGLAHYIPRTREWMEAALRDSGL